MSYATGISHRIGQFHYAGEHVLARRTVNNREFVIGIAGAYNARGLIGSEKNGIFVLDDTAKNVVMDEHFKEASGYNGPSDRQTAEFERVKALSDKDFMTFLTTHPRYRFCL